MTGRRPHRDQAGARQTLPQPQTPRPAHRTRRVSSTSTLSDAAGVRMGVSAQQGYRRARTSEP